jgi:carbon starvation protein CstA
VVFGCILGGAVHDFLAGAMSIRNGGEGLPDIIGRYLGRIPRHLSTLFILILMVLVGTVFVKGPAMLIAQMLPAGTVGDWAGATGFLTSTLHGNSVWLWTIMLVIFGYYVLATLLPIHTIIGRVYPVFAVALLVMVAGLAMGILSGRLELPRFTLANLHPAGTVAWPVIFITVSCGAVSGFHATQCALMARCMRTERRMRLIFYGAMIGEGFIGLVWASAAQGYFGSSELLQKALADGGPGAIVYEICTSIMGAAGGVLAVLGVIVLPITSGDTAFRVARLILADYLKLPQTRVRNRYLLALPMFVLAAVLNFVDFTVIWRYFGWANQALAAVTLWAATVYLGRRGGYWWLAAFPAVFMTVMTTTYILVEETGFGLQHTIGTVIGLIAGAAALTAFLAVRPRLRSSAPPS